MSDHSYEDNVSASCDISVTDERSVALVLQSLPSRETASRMRAIFEALADDTRLRILMALEHSELCVCDLAEISGISQSGVSHQLRTLREHRLVAFRRDGKRAVYRLADNHVRALIRVALEHADEPMEHQL